MSRTHPKEEAVVFASTEPQRGLFFLLSYFMHFGREGRSSSMQIFSGRPMEGEGGSFFSDVNG